MTGVNNHINNSVNESQNILLNEKIQTLIARLYEIQEQKNAIYGESNQKSSCLHRQLARIGTRELSEIDVNILHLIWEQIPRSGIKSENICHCALFTLLVLRECLLIANNRIVVKHTGFAKMISQYTSDFFHLGEVEQSFIQ